MSLFHLLRRNALSVIQLAFLLFFSGVITPLHAQNAIGPVPAKKVRASAPALNATIMALNATPTNSLSFFSSPDTYTPVYKEIDAEATPAFRVVATDTGEASRPFWLGQSDFLAICKKPYTGLDFFTPQVYKWKVLQTPIIPLVPLSEGPSNIQRAVSVLVDYSQFLGPKFIELKQDYDNIPPWAREFSRLALQESVGLEETAADGRPLTELKSTISQANKHFYWSLGDARDSTLNFPQTTETEVSISDGQPGTVPLTGRVKINWHKPTRTVWDVEIKLWDWVADTEAPSANTEEWIQKLLTDEDFQRTVIQDTEVQAAEFVVQQASRGAGKIIVRVVAKGKVPASWIARRVLIGAKTSTLRPTLRPDGTFAPKPSWHANTKIKVIVKDEVRRAEFPTPSLNINPDPATQPDPAAQPTATPDPNGAEEEEEGQRDAKDDDFLEGGELYLYYKNSDYRNSHWSNPSNRSAWPEGYYLTDITPSQAQTLRKGQLSFALFGHPYEWDDATSINWLKVNIGEIKDAQGLKIADALPKPSNNTRSLCGSDTSDVRVTYRDKISAWANRRVYVYEGDETVNNIKQFGQQRISMTPVPITFQSNIAHTSPIIDGISIRGVPIGGHVIYDGSPGAMDVPASPGRYPAEDRDLSTGEWYKPGLPKEKWKDANGNIISMNTENPATGSIYRADSDWYPAPSHPGNPNLYKVTGGYPIKYRQGYPEFLPCTYFTAEINPMKGIDAVDFAASGVLFGTIQTNPKNWIDTHHLTTPANVNMTANPLVIPNQVIIPARAPSWVWHHHQDLRHMQLVPSIVNTGGQRGVAHYGGAHWAKSSRW